MCPDSSQTTRLLYQSEISLGAFTLRGTFVKCRDLVTNPPGQQEQPA